MNLDSALSEIKRLSPLQKTNLQKLGIISVRDLLYFFPTRYLDFSTISKIDNLLPSSSGTVFGTIKSIKTQKTFKQKIPSTIAVVTDSSKKNLNLIWFHQPFLGKTINKGDTVRISGNIIEKNGKLSMINPEIKTIKTIPIETNDNLFQDDLKEETKLPIYKETKGITSRFIYHLILKIFNHPDFRNIEDPLAENIRQELKLPELKTALIWIHSPKKKSDAEVAKKRFSFEYIFLMQIEKLLERKTYEEKGATAIISDQKKVSYFINTFPFVPTNAQNKSILSILKDLEKDQPMSRLLEGDVGSGKTFVAAVACFACIKTNPKNQNFGSLQVAYMAPTEVLATQLFESFIEFFKKEPIDIALLTGKECRKFPSKVNKNNWTNISKNQLSKWIENGEIPIVIGTHSLIQKKINFKNLGLVIIDEQHRFGTKQRKALVRKYGHVPHFLSMSATPIPRTLALTIYGDLDLSVIDELPKGRKPVETIIALPSERKEIYEKIRLLLKKGKQAYVICPRIDEPDENQENVLLARSVMAEKKYLAEKIFPEFKIGHMHSKMTKTEKQKQMEDFEKHKTDILVATSVIEVGVNIPNATTIIIEGAERFGLAQLHQLRGRVKRSSDQSYCYLFSDTENEKSIERLRALRTAEDGFALAEIDMNQRGIGDLAGQKQWGISDLAMEAIRNPKLVEIAREKAKLAVTNFDLQIPELKKEIDRRQKIHLE